MRTLAHDLSPEMETQLVRLLRTHSPAQKAQAFVRLVGVGATAYVERHLQALSASFAERIASAIAATPAWAGKERVSFFQKPRAVGKEV